MSYSAGHHVEDRLTVRLQKLGCELTQSEELDHKYKLDFVITRFEGIAKMRPIGVQVTTRAGERDKIREFVSKQKTFEYVEKALYIELWNDEIDQGVDRLVYASILVFLFSTEHAQVPYLGVRVRPNYTVEFFNLEAEAGRAGDGAGDRGPDRGTDRVGAHPGAAAM